jgi:GNAT superfamily N-acetyltransferase
MAEGGATGSTEPACPRADAPSPPPAGGEVLRLVTLAERPDLEDALGRHNGAAWPTFMFQEPVANELWHHLDEELAGWQLIFLDPDDRIAAAANSAPFAWDGTSAGLPDGWGEQFRRTIEQMQAGVPPDTLGALQIVVAHAWRGSGLAGRMVEELQRRGRAAGHRALVACVRPTDKHRYPLVPIERYARWTRSDGEPFDAWIRLHVRLGGRIDRPAPRSMTMRGSIAEWEQWTGMAFPESGEYVIPFATRPLSIDRAADVGTYFDENVWVVHDLG